MYTGLFDHMRCVLVLAVLFLLAGCSQNVNSGGIHDMAELTPRLQAMFEKTKTVCFGRFIVDVPLSTTVVWGEVVLPLGVTVYPRGIDTVDGMAEKFIDELRREKAIYLKKIPLLISVDDVNDPKGRIVTGYDGFEAISDLKINGYFNMNGDGVIIDARPLIEDRETTVALMKGMARRLRQRDESEVPSEPGNCIDGAFLPDSHDHVMEPAAELLNVGFRLKEFPDAHFSISVAPANPHNPHADSLEAQWKRIRESTSTAEEQRALVNARFFRETQREIHGWTTGYEVLFRAPDEERVHSYHDFQVKFRGVPRDLLKPYADIQFQTGVKDNAAGGTKTNLTDEEAIAIWDKVTSTIRVRPTSGALHMALARDPVPRIPLGELSATGRVCLQTGWWEPHEEEAIRGAKGQLIKAGERMPYVVVAIKPTLWQRLTGEDGPHRVSTLWKLVRYDSAPADSKHPAQGTLVATAESNRDSTNHAVSDAPQDGAIDTQSNKKG